MRDEPETRVELAAECQEAVYRFLEGLLLSQQYRKLKKRERGIVRRFGAKFTGLSRAQVKRMIGRWTKHRHIEKRVAPRPRFARRYHTIIAIGQMRVIVTSWLIQRCALLHHRFSS